MAGTDVWPDGTVMPCSELNDSQSWAMARTSSYPVATQNPPYWSLWVRPPPAGRRQRVLRFRPTSGCMWSKWSAHQAALRTSGASPSRLVSLTPPRPADAGVR